MNLNATLIGQSIAFAVFVFFCMKFVWPPVMQALRDRQARIAEGLDAAARADKDLELARARAAGILKDAKAEAHGLVEQANRRAAEIVREAQDKALVEADRIRQQAMLDLEQEVNRSKDQLRTQVGALAVKGAEVILRSNIDEAANAKLVEQLAAEL
jgi:F-type H+-transporting ATPase subunit b